MRLQSSGSITVNALACQVSSCGFESRPLHMNIYIVQRADWEWSEIDSLWEDYDEALKRAKEIAIEDSYKSVLSLKSAQERVYILTVPLNQPGAGEKVVQLSSIA